ncbi:MAG: PLD nuclease N-terminal domain-containing protein [Propionibacteriaceae bacterium]|jgi:hypothetical protein|nr:PLD nuclease N-terminal domain-containing protein [Propionibacteriaceae bacterium]
MPRFLVFAIPIILDIYCLIELAQADAEKVRTMPKWLWAFAILLLPIIGALCWFLFGRPSNDGGGGWGKDPEPLAPDDDPEFLKSLRH